MLLDEKLKRRHLGAYVAPDVITIFRSLPGDAKKVYKRKLERQVSQSQMLAAALRYFRAQLLSGKISYEDFAGDSED